MSQTHQILAHLRKGRSITPLQALHEYKSLRLAARIAELKGAGFPITKRMISRNGKRFAQYTLEAT